MPREMLYPMPNPDGSNADRRVEIGWSRTGYVQIATTVLQPGADRDSDYFGGTEKEPAQRSWDGQFVDMNRHQINELIRKLRRARDQAFGRDE